MIKLAPLFAAAALFLPVMAQALPDPPKPPPKKKVVKKKIVLEPPEPVPTPDHP